MTSEDIKQINIVRCIGIFFVVMGHYSWMYFDTFQAYIFHMPLFFFLGGLTINKNKTTYQRIMGVVKRLIPYVIISYIVIGILAILIEKYTGYYTGEIFRNGIFETISYAIKNNMHNNKLFMVGWFLICYIPSYILTNLFLHLTKHTPTKIRTPLILVIALTAGYYAIEFLSHKYTLSKSQFLNIECQILVATMFMLLGFGLKKLFVNADNVIAFLLCLLLIATLVKGGFLTSSIMSWSIYHSSFSMFVIGAMSAIYCCFFLARLLTKSVSSDIIILIGANSKSIMTYHLFTFIIITLILNKLMGGEIPTPPYYKTWYTMPLYISFGLIFPVVLSVTFDVIKEKATKLRFIFTKKIIKL